MELFGRAPKLVWIPSSSDSILTGSTSWLLPEIDSLLGSPKVSVDSLILYSFLVRGLRDSAN